MEWPDPWTVLSVFAQFVIAPLFLNLLTLALTKGRVGIQLTELFSWRRKQITSDPDAAPRQVRRQHRRPTTQLPRTYGNTTPEALARSIRCSGRVPIDLRKPRPWRPSFWQTIKNILLPSPTNPKSAFTLTDWQYQPITPTGLAKRYPYSGGSILRLSLHPHENRSHLKRSLKADKSGVRARRLVVIASVQDMFKPSSWVRCIVVNAYTLHLVKGDPHAVVLLTADPLSLEEPNVHRRKQKDVPADALWLIVPTSNYRAPSTIWGQMPERHNHQTMPIDPDTQESDDIDYEAIVKERRTDQRAIRIALWLYLGLCVPGFFWLYVTLIPHLSLPIMAFVVWFVVFANALVAALLYLAFAAFRAWRWRRRDDQTRRTWQSRTAECLSMGAMLRFGPFFSKEEWREYYAQTFHMSDGAPTGSVGGR